MEKKRRFMGVSATPDEWKWLFRGLWFIVFGALVAGWFILDKVFKFIGGLY